MKRKSIILLIVIMVMVSLVSCTATPTLEKADKSYNLGESAMENLYDLAAKAPNRQVVNKAPKHELFVFETYLKNYFSSIENDPYSFEAIPTSYSDKILDRTIDTKNFVFKKLSPTSKGTILFSTSYDNLYDENNKADGSYESGASIAVLLTLAKSLAKYRVDYDLEFAFFSGEISDWNGTKNYLSTISAEEKDAIVLAIDFQRLIGGDNLYMYSRDNKTDYNDYFYNVANSNLLNVKSVPKSKQIMRGKIDEDSKLSYVHTGLFSNAVRYLDAKVPSITYMSLNWEEQNKLTDVEMKGLDNVYQTSEDTYENLLERVGSQEEVINRFNTVLDSVMLSILDYDFTEAVKNARDQEPMTFFEELDAPIAIVLTILAASVIVGVYFYVKYRITKNKEKLIKEVKLPNLSEMVKPKVDIDPFDDGEVIDNDPDDKNGENNKNDTGDDIFN